MKINTKRHTQRRQMHTTIVISQSSTKSMVKQNERKTHKQNERKTHKQRERERITVKQTWAKMGKKGGVKKEMQKERGRDCVCFGSLPFTPWVYIL